MRRKFLNTFKMSIFFVFVTIYTGLPCSVYGMLNELQAEADVLHRRWVRSQCSPVWIATTNGQMSSSGQISGVIKHLQHFDGQIVDSGSCVSCDSRRTLLTRIRTVDDSIMKLVTAASEK